MLVGVVGAVLHPLQDTTKGWTTQNKSTNWRRALRSRCCQLNRFGSVSGVSWVRHGDSSLWQGWLRCVNFQCASWNENKVGQEKLNFREPTPRFLQKRAAWCVCAKTTVTWTVARVVFVAFFLPAVHETSGSEWFCLLSQTWTVFFSFWLVTAPQMRPVHGSACLKQ